MKPVPKLKKSLPVTRTIGRSLSSTLAGEIENALHLVRPYGSIEIFVQNNVVTQITARNIKKTSVGIT